MEKTPFDYTWVLWSHDQDNKDYSIKSYVNIADVNTPQKFWTVVDAITKEAWESGMFFFMRYGFEPLWDSPENEAGGAWSKKIPIADTHAAFVDMMVHCVTNQLLVNRKETLVGITVSPKGPFSIIKIWNTTTNVSTNDYLNHGMKMVSIGDDVTYTAHKARPK